MSTQDVNEDSEKKQSENQKTTINKFDTKNQVFHDDKNKFKNIEIPGHFKHYIDFTSPDIDTNNNNNNTFHNYNNNNTSNHIQNGSLNHTATKKHNTVEDNDRIRCNNNIAVETKVDEN